MASEGWVGWEPTGGESHPDHWDEGEARECPSDPSCGTLSWSIDVLTRQLQYRRWDMQQPKNGGGDRSHKNHYEIVRQKLRELIALAKAKGCPYNPQADIEVNRGAKYPTPYF